MLVELFLLQLLLVLVRQRKQLSQHNLVAQVVAQAGQYQMLFQVLRLMEDLVEDQMYWLFLVVAQVVQILDFPEVREQIIH